MNQLENLQDIHLPNTIHNWPLAPGWWLLLIVIISAIVMIIRKVTKQRSVNYIKKQAITKLNKDHCLDIEQTMIVLKWVCMHYFKREDVASLFGDKFLSYLADKLPAPQQGEFIALAENALLQQYRKSADSLYAEEFQQAALLWLNNASFINPELPNTDEEVR